MTARRRNASARIARSPVRSAPAMAASYRSIASGTHPARSLARASCRRSAVGRTAPRLAGVERESDASEVTRSPRQRVLRKVPDAARDGPRQDVRDRGQQIDDLQVVGGVGDVLRQRPADDATVGVAHRALRLHGLTLLVSETIPGDEMRGGPAA